MNNKSKRAVKQLKALEKEIKGYEMRLAAEWPKPWQVLISTIMSAMTRDEVTIEVCEVLFKKYPSMKKLGNAPLKSIEREIRPINYYKTKAKNVKATCKILAGKKIPRTVEELIKLPGVGRKVANVYLAEAHKEDAIGVDTHVARISQKLGWSKNHNKHKIEKDLEKLFPKKYWREINYIVVTFGRAFWTRRRKEDEILSKVRLIK
jgi:endonuclease-3